MLKKRTAGQPAELYLQGRAIRETSLSRPLNGVSDPTACLQILQVLLEEVLQALQ